MSFLPRAVVLVLLPAALAGSAAAQGHKPSAKVVLYKERLAAQWDTVNCVKNVFKLNPLLFFRGEIPLYHERALSSRLSAELAVGITYRNYLGRPFTDAKPDPFSAGTRILAKPAFHIGARYYLTDDLEPEGLYLQCEFAYSDHSKDISTKDSTGAFTGNSLRDQRVYNDVRLYAGYQRLASTSNWLFDAYCGLGLRARAVHAVVEHLDLADGSWDYTEEETHDHVPVFFLGVKLGYGF